MISGPLRNPEGSLDPLLLVLFALLHLIVLLNAVVHDPLIGYDARGHLAYVETLADGELPDQNQSPEFFSPPLPYLIPALLISTADVSTFTAAKYAQFANVLLSIGSCMLMLAICGLLNRAIALRRSTLILLALFTVYYKTFAFVRGEPYVAFFGFVIVYMTVVIAGHRKFSFKWASALGAAWGLCALSRQWGFFIILASALLLLGKAWRSGELRRPLLQSLLVAGILGSLSGGWFYVGLKMEHGSMTAFNRTGAPEFRFSNQPLKFYIGLSPKELFHSPVRPAFPNEFIPIFYSETWGDYWGFFTHYAWSTEWLCWKSSMK